MSSCPIEGGLNSSASTPFSVAAITIIALLSTIALVLMITLIAAWNSRKSERGSTEPISERRGMRNSLQDISEYDDSWIHPSWLAASSSIPRESRQGEHPLCTLIPPALSALNTANAREKRLNLVRHSLLSNAQRIDWKAFENRSTKKQQAHKSRQKQREKNGEDWPLWL